MNLEDYGPPRPDNMIALPPFRLRRWAMIGTPNGLGEICLTFHGCARGYEEDIILLIACDPRTGYVVRCTMVRPDTLEHELLALDYLPGIVADIARSAVLDAFVGRDPEPWQQPIRSP
jgi:hypothetical protein